MQSYLVILDVVVIGAYVARALILDAEAKEWLKQNVGILWRGYLFQPELFLPDGEPYRLRAVRFIRRGLIAVGAYLAIRYWWN